MPVLPGKLDQQAIHFPFGPLSRGRVTNFMLITAFEANVTPRSPGDMGLVHKYVNLKQPYNLDIKEKVTAKFSQEKENSLYMKSPTPEALCEEVVLQIQTIICGAFFRIIY